MFIQLVCILQELGVNSYGALEFTSAAEKKTDEWLSCYLLLMHLLKEKEKNFIVLDIVIKAVLCITAMKLEKSSYEC
jgi:hypothetical protein